MAKPDPRERLIDLQLPAYAKPFLYPARMKSMRGGRDGAKSHTTAQIMLMRMAGLLGEYGYPQEPVTIASCRDHNTNLKHSVKRAVDKYAKKLFAPGEFTIYETKILHRNGSEMTFHGVTNQEDSFLSMEGIDVFWMEQAEMLQDEMIKIEPTIRKPGSELWFIWNPYDRDSYCWTRFVENPQPGDVDVHVTYRDNAWLSEESERMRLYYKEHEPEIYPWMYEGEPYDGDGSTKVLPRATLDKCVEAYRQGLAPSEEDRRPFTYAGLDLADGGQNKCSLTIRSGPVVEFRKRWPGVTGDLQPAAETAHKGIRGYRHPVIRVSYDSNTSGMRAELSRVQVAANDGPAYGIRPVAFGGAVNGPDVEYEVGRPNKQVFARLNIQMADALRLRANRTVRLMNGDRTIRPMDCLFIRNDIPELETYLKDMMRPIRRVRPDSGKWELEKAPDGQTSPDDFDSTCLAFVRDTFKLRAR